MIEEREEDRPEWGIEEEKLVVERCPLPVARGRVRVDSNWPDGNPTASVAQALFQGSERVAFISPNRITAAGLELLTALPNRHEAGC